MILIKVLLAWLLADFITGIIHWYEDRYLDMASLNFLHNVAAENDLHHRKPTAMLLNSGWTNMKSAAFVGWPLAALLFWFGAPTVAWLTPFFASFGNLIHRWSHKPKRELPCWILMMQRIGLFISHEHHDLHHRTAAGLIPKRAALDRFCAMTDWLNPLLDRYRIWSRLESILRKFGIKTTAEKNGTNPAGGSG